MNLLPHAPLSLADPAAVTVTLRSARLPRNAARAAPLSITYGLGKSCFGECLIATTARGICWLDLAPQAQSLGELQRIWNPQQLLRDDRQGSRLAAVAFSGQSYALDLCGTDFQLRVWLALLKIPAGTQVSYGQLARSVNVPRAARAVGGAVGANGVAVLVPCHRVVPANGSPGAYRWGSRLKVALLEREKMRGQEAA